MARDPNAGAYARVVVVKPFAVVAPTTAERTEARVGDDLVPDATVVMDRAFDLPAPSAEVWPWLLQLGKQRAGWYLTRRVEALFPSSRRALRRLDPALVQLAVGDVIPDWGGRDASFTVAAVEAPHVLVHRSTRGAARMSWALTLTDQAGGSRLHLRLRLGGVKHQTIGRFVGGAVDLLTVAGLAAGLRERLVEESS